MNKIDRKLFKRENKCKYCIQIPCRFTSKLIYITPGKYANKDVQFSVVFGHVLMQIQRYSLKESSSFMHTTVQKFESSFNI